MNLFKIRKVNNADSEVRQHSEINFTPETKQDRLEKSIETCQQNMNNLISMFETFMKQTNNNKDLGIYDPETLNKAQMQF